MVYWAQFGLNTPAYFAIDNLDIASVPETASVLSLLGLGALGFGSLLKRKQR